jgi:urease accessory protein
MQLVHDHLHEWNRALPRVALRIERGTLAKRRWRGVADDGAEFGFDLEHPLEDGDVFHQGASAVYVIAQKAEAVIEVRLANLGGEEAARTGWLFGNLHQPVEVTHGAIRAAYDSAVEQMLQREEIAFVRAEAVFKPLHAAAGHHHEHHHHH